MTKDEISLADARQLAIDIQTAREHTLRELGKRFEVMYGKNMTKEEIARAENISKAKVTRAFQAAAVPDEMIAVFPVASDLALPDYQLLLQISEDANAKNVPIGDLVDTVRERIAETEGAKEDKAKILAIFKAESKSLKPAPVKSVVVEKSCETSLTVANMLERSPIRKNGLSPTSSPDSRLKCKLKLTKQ